MKDEIKNILKCLEMDMLDNKQIEKLLDYITNLQEKVNQYENPDDMTLFYMWLDEKAKDKIKQLQEENKRLKEERQNINNRNCNQKIANKKLMEDIERLRTNLKTHKRRRKKQTHKKNIYKSRNEKAIEYCNLYTRLSAKDLLNILKGDNK